MNKHEVDMKDEAIDQNLPSVHLKDATHENIDRAVMRPVKEIASQTKNIGSSYNTTLVMEGGDSSRELQFMSKA